MASLARYLAAIVLFTAAGLKGVSTSIPLDGYAPPSGRVWVMQLLLANVEAILAMFLVFCRRNVAPVVSVYESSTHRRE